MSGGYFDYCQFKMDEPIEKLEFMLRAQHDNLDVEVIKNVRFALGLMIYSRECLDLVDRFMSDDTGREQFLEDFKILREKCVNMTNDTTDNGGNDV